MLVLLLAAQPDSRGKDSRKSSGRWSNVGAILPRGVAARGTTRSAAALPRVCRPVCRGSEQRLCWTNLLRNEGNGSAGDVGGAIAVYRLGLQAAETWGAVRVWVCPSQVQFASPGDRVRLTPPGEPFIGATHFLSGWVIAAVAILAAAVGRLTRWLMVRNRWYLLIGLGALVRRPLTATRLCGTAPGERSWRRSQSRQTGDYSPRRRAELPAAAERRCQPVSDGVLVSRETGSTSNWPTEHWGGCRARSRSDRHA